MTVGRGSGFSVLVIACSTTLDHWDKVIPRKYSKRSVQKLLTLFLFFGYVVIVELIFWRLIMYRNGNKLIYSRYEIVDLSHIFKKTLSCKRRIRTEGWITSGYLKLVVEQRVLNPDLKFEQEFSVAFSEIWEHSDKLHILAPIGAELKFQDKKETFNNPRRNFRSLGVEFQLMSILLVDTPLVGTPLTIEYNGTVAEIVVDDDDDQIEVISYKL